jgi:lysozyme family protein
MADFLPAYERMILNEGGYKLTNVKADRGGMTYAGIARNRWPLWGGWHEVDAGTLPSADTVREFYRSNFWDALKLDGIENQDVARTLFDFAVNAGTGTAAKLAQVVAGTTPDGQIGPKSIAAINAVDPAELFMARLALAKLARYEQIVTKDRTQGRFLLGWLRRTLHEAQ